jgi:hypothetical protein
MKGWLRNRLRRPKKPRWVRGAASGRLTPPAGLCDPCRELLAKRPVVVLRAEDYPMESEGGGTTP